MFAKRTEWERRLNRLTKTVRRLKDKGSVLLDLTESNPTLCHFHYPSDILSVLSRPEAFSYTPSPKGLLFAREEVARYYSEKGVKVDPEQIFLTASTSEAYSFLFRLLLNPKDHLLVPRPSYPLLDYLAALHDLLLEPYPLVYDTRWRIDREAFVKKSRSGTKAVLLIHPNNPTGSFVKKEEQSFLLHSFKEREVSQICDEVFLDYAYEEVPDFVPTFAGEEALLTFTLSGISKVLGLPQMKLSWIVVSGPKRLREEAIARLEVISDTYLSVNTLSQLALKRWFEYRPLLQKEIQKRLFANRKVLLEKERSSSGCRLFHAEGGWYAILQLPPLRSEEKWCLEFLEKASVLVHPGYFFDFEEGTQVILSLLVPSDRFEEGVERLFSHVEKMLESPFGGFNSDSDLRRPYGLRKPRPH